MLGTNLYRAIFARRFFYKWNRWLLHCGLKGLGINNCGDASGEYFYLKQLIEKKQKPVLFDVGANVGEWSRRALEINPSSSIFAFEPNTAPFEKCSKISQIKAFNMACGSKEERRTIYDRPDYPISTHASLDRGIISKLGKGVVEKEIEVVTLDQIIASHEIKNIDLLKIDVEGFEYEVLRGAKKAIKNGVIHAIQFEFNDLNVYRRRFFRDFQKLLPQFVFYRLLPKGKIPLRSYDPVLHEIFAYQNLLAIRE